MSESRGADLRRLTSSAQQHGISLLVVMVIALLTTLLVLWASRTALFNEMMTGHDSDYQRAVEAAHSMVRDAELDIRGLQVDGTPCTAVGCRAWGHLDAAAGKVFYPTNEDEFVDLHAALAATAPSCAAGICVPDRVPAQFWTDKALLDAMKRLASTYGAHTGATVGESGNPFLASGRAWYWVELLPYDMSAAMLGGPAEALAPDAETPFIYRITAVAQGRKPATQAVIQTTWVWKKLRS